MESAVFLLASFGAAIAATLAGFGSSTLLIPVALLFMDPKTGVFLVACFHLFNNIFRVRFFWNRIDFGTFIRFGIPSVLFAFVGALLITVVPVGALKQGIAIFLILFSIFSLLNPQFSVRKSAGNAVLGGGLSGLLAGLIGLGGAIRSTFLITFKLPKEVYVGTAAMIALVVDLTRIPTYLITGIVQDASRYLLLPWLFLSAYVGVRIGKILLKRIRQETFRTIVLAVILLVGIRLLF